MHTTLPDGRHVPVRSAPRDIVRKLIPVIDREIAARRTEMAALDATLLGRLRHRERRQELEQELQMLEAGRADAEARLRSLLA